MKDLFFLLALLTAGISLSMGTICFAVGLKRKDKTNLIFGIMSFCLFLFVLLPPVGFITGDQIPYPLVLIIKRIFIFAYYLLFPWFLFFYTNRKDGRAPLLISIAVVTCFVLMAMSVEIDAKPAWRLLAVILFHTIAFYGIYTGIRQYKNQNKKKGSWLLLVMGVFTILSLITANNELSDYLGTTTISSSIHLHALFVVFIMGLQLVFEILEKHRLEKVVSSHTDRMQAFMKNVPLFILELDKSGNITYINPFALTSLGYASSQEILNKNCFDILVTDKETQNDKTFFEKAISGEKLSVAYRNVIKTKTNQYLIMSWVYYHNQSYDGQISGITAIGRDITNEENTNRIIDQLRLEIEKENISETKEITEPNSEIIGTSKAIGYALQKARLVATTHAPVLLEGETGVGKELFADMIHNLSSRNNMPLVKVNCGALPKELIEDELFGHEKGAFTSAIQSRKGRFELADGGTIFLDEIGELPLDMQPKLLRVLQNGEFERVGGQKTIKVDVRIIAATNRDLTQEVSAGRYRDDLFYRLNVYPITIPALRKRKEDLPALINHFITLKSKKYNKHLDQISKADMQRLMDYSWPGNVRELINVIERSVIASEGSILKLEWLAENSNGNGAEQNHSTPDTLEQIERDHIIKVMEECQWKINGENGAAERLDMNPNTLRSKMKKLGITRPIKNLLS